MERKQLKDIIDGMKKLRNAIEDYMDSVEMDEADEKAEKKEGKK